MESKMDTHTAMMTRRTVHYWKDLPIDEKALEQALLAAHMAPCHKYTWPWRFTRVGKQARQKIFDLTVKLKKGDKPELSERIRDQLIRKIQNPAELVVVSMIITENAFTHKENYAAVSCAIQNLSLSLHASGYGSKWSTGKVTRDVNTYSFLGIDNRIEEIVGFIWMGVPDIIPNPPERPDIEIVTRTID